MQHEHHGHHRDAAAIAPPGKDPVCGMSVDPATAKHVAQHEGRSYFFCGAGCRSKFLADPAKYLTRKPAVAPTAPPGTIYTCPMHPQIRQPGPGTCPICGMALEPEVASADTGPNPELADMARRFWIGLALTVPIVVLETGGHIAGGHGWIALASVQTLSETDEHLPGQRVHRWAERGIVPGMRKVFSICRVGR